MQMYIKSNSTAVRPQSPLRATGSVRRKLVRWIETVLFSVGAPVLGWLLAPNDPFLVMAKFPWLALVPMFIGLQHGFSPAVISVALLITGAVGNAELFGVTPMGTIAFWAIGCLVLGLACGGLRDKLNSRITELTKSNDERGTRLDRIERAYCVLNLSHTQLEERLAAERWSLQTAVEDAERRISLPSTTSLSEVGEILLDIFANHGMIQCASLYLSPTPLALPSTPTAVLGRKYPSVAMHPLVQRALSAGRLASITGKSPGILGNRDVLAAVPLMTSAKRCIGVIAVHDMPFMAFHAEHLANLALLAGRLADSVEPSLPRLASATAQPVEPYQSSNIQTTNAEHIRRLAVV